MLSKLTRTLSIAAAALGFALMPAQADIDLSGKTVEWGNGRFGKMGQFLCAAPVRRVAGQPDRGREIHAGCRFNQGRKLVPETKKWRWHAAIRQLGFDAVPIPP